MSNKKPRIEETTSSSVTAATEALADGPVRVRKSILELSADEVTLLKTAFAGIMSLPYNNPKSYFALASWHGIGAFVCQHDTQLFWPWHRKYVLEFENALRSIAGCAEVTLPYWDACDPDPQKTLLPNWVYEAPFGSYDVKSALSNTDYSTFLSQVRAHYPERFYNFFVATRGRTSRYPTAQITSNLQRQSISNKTTAALNLNTWAAQVNSSTRFEAPHGDIHVASGLWMRQVPLAAFDPLFWFHHSNVERIFKIWQKRHRATTVAGLTAISGGFAIQWDAQFPRRSSASLPLVLDSFPGTFREVVWQENIQYTTGSHVLVGFPFQPMASFALSEFPHAVVTPTVSLMVKNIDRSKIEGTFIVRVFFGSEHKDITVFQTGVGCDTCQANKLISVSTLVPMSLVSSVQQFAVKVVVPSLLEEKAETEAVDFGNPTVNARLLFQ